MKECAMEAALLLAAAAMHLAAAIIDAMVRFR